MLGPISFDGLFASRDINDGTNALEAIDWVICGGESGRGARPMNPQWARELRDQCATVGVPFLFKQWGEWGEGGSIEATGLAHHGWWETDPGDGGVQRREWAGPMLNGVEIASQRPEVFLVGKKAAGRLLDGRTHDEFPATR
jgi:protein gp37